MSSRGGPPSNRQIAAAFELLADLLEIEGASRHRVLAYRRGAARALAAEDSLAAMALAGTATDLPDIGATLQAKIAELAERGEIAALVALAERVPPGLARVARLGGLGPKRARALWSELGVTDLDSLRAAVAAGRVESVAGIGPRTAADLVGQLAATDAGERAAVSIGRALPAAERLVADLRAHPAVARAELAGGLRRGAAQVHDADLAVATDDPRAVAQAVCDHSLVARVVARGAQRTVIETHGDLRVEVRYGPPASFGNLLQHLTGSAAHNTRLRELARGRGLSLSEHGITDAAGNVTVHADEDAIYRALGLAPIPPELREDRDELAAAAAGTIPALIELADLRGELHAHTDWSDGRCTLAELTAAARERGLEYLVITDHSPGRGGPDRAGLERQREAIERIDAGAPDLIVRQGAEVDIRADGSLDLSDAALAELDFVIASVHSAFGQSRAATTARLLAAIANPFVDLIGHPTARRRGRREPMEMDLAAVATAAAERGVALEINGQPERLDLDPDMARAAAAHGVEFVIGSDAHRQDGLDLRRFGVAVARRGWLGPDRVVNARTWPEIAIRRERRIAASGR